MLLDESLAIYLVRQLPANSDKRPEIGAQLLRINQQPNGQDTRSVNDHHQDQSLLNSKYDCQNYIEDDLSEISKKFNVVGCSTNSDQVAEQQLAPTLFRQLVQLNSSKLLPIDASPSPDHQTRTFIDQSKTNCKTKVDHHDYIETIIGSSARTDNSGYNQDNHNDHQQNEKLMSLNEAIGQVLFSGFIVPSWLLISGPVKALQAIRLAWLESKLTPPIGFKIKTIGHLRSVKVDQFGSLVQALEQSQIATSQQQSQPTTAETNENQAAKAVDLDNWLSSVGHQRAGDGYLETINRRQTQETKQAYNLSSNYNNHRDNNKKYLEKSGAERTEVDESKIVRRKKIIQVNNNDNNSDEDNYRDSFRLVARREQEELEKQETQIYAKFSNRQQPSESAEVKAELCMQTNDSSDCKVFSCRDFVDEDNHKLTITTTTTTTSTNQTTKAKPQPTGGEKEPLSGAKMLISNLKSAILDAIHDLNEKFASVGAGNESKGHDLSQATDANELSTRPVAAAAASCKNYADHDVTTTSTRLNTKSSSCNNHHQNDRSRMQTNNNIENFAGYHLSDILECMSSKSSLTLLTTKLEPDIKLIDIVLDSLLAQKSLKTRPMTQAEMVNLLERQQRQQQSQDGQGSNNNYLSTKKANETSSNRGKSPPAAVDQVFRRIRVNQSAYFSQMIQDANYQHQTIAMNANNHHNDLEQPAFITTTQAIHSRLPKIVKQQITTVTTRPTSKSMTLDSGIQSWDLASSSTNEEDLSPLQDRKNTNSNGGSYAPLRKVDHEPFRNQQNGPPPISIQSNCRAGSVEQKSSHGEARFSLRRSFSFAQNKQRSASGSRAKGTAVGEAGCPLASCSTTTTSSSMSNEEQQQQHRNNNNLNSQSQGRFSSISQLLRSRSLRIISGGGKQQHQQQQQQHRRHRSSSIDDVTDADADNEDTVMDDIDYKDVYRQRNERLRDNNCDEQVPTTTTTFNSKIKSTPTTTFDYLTAAQQANAQSKGLRRRTFSLRRTKKNAGRSGRNQHQPNRVNSELDSRRNDHDNKLTQHHLQDDPLATPTNSARILLFLRRLFTIRRQTTTTTITTLTDETAASTAAIGHLHYDPDRLQMEATLTNEQHHLHKTSLNHLMATTTTTAHYHHHHHHHHEAHSFGSSRVDNDINKPSATKSHLLTPLCATGGGLSDSSAGSSANSSLGTNSLGEIIEASRRPFREERLRAQSLSRASSWQTNGGIGGHAHHNRSDHHRSESSLSPVEDNDDSNSSTVSQQLRQHLDEAFKRHRKCTSRREKEFIDSINILRQASRHALQAPTRPLSKSRQSASKTPGSDASQQHCQRCCKCCNTANEDVVTSQGVEITSSEQHRHNDQDGHESGCNCDCQSREFDKGDGSDLTRRRRRQQLFDDDREEHGFDGAQHYLDSKFSDLRLEKTVAHYDDDDVDDDELMLEDEDSQRRNLLILRKTVDIGTSALQISTLAPAAPAASSDHHHLHYESDLAKQSGNNIAAAMPATTTTCCCYLCQPTTLLHHHQQQQLAASVCPFGNGGFLRTAPNASATNANCLLTNDCNNKHLVDHHSHQTAGHHNQMPLLQPDFCCPLWRTMVHNYYQTYLFGSAAGLLVPPPPPPPLNGFNEQQQQQLSPIANASALINPNVQSSSSFLIPINHSQTNVTGELMHQQHQHNTTIDLKIEIGADFQQNQHQQQQQQEHQVIVTSSSNDHLKATLPSTGHNQADHLSETVATTPPSTTPSSSSSSKRSHRKRKNAKHTSVINISPITSTQPDDQLHYETSHLSQPDQQEQHQLSNNIPVIETVRRVDFDSLDYNDTNVMESTLVTDIKPDVANVPNNNNNDYIDKDIKSSYSSGPHSIQARSTPVGASHVELTTDHDSCEN